MWQHVPGSQMEIIGVNWAKRLEGTMVGQQPAALDHVTCLACVDI